MDITARSRAITRAVKPLVVSPNLTLSGRIATSALTPSPSFNESSDPGIALSAASEEALEAAWRESRIRGDGTPMDSADLVIGLLDVAPTDDLLGRFGVTVDGIRTAKQRSDGYRLSARFQSVATTHVTKTSEVSRIARLVAVRAARARRAIIEPEDILETVAVDGLGWGVGILDDLGVDRRLLHQSLTQLIQMTGTAGTEPVAQQVTLSAAGPGPSLAGVQYASRVRRIVRAPMGGGIVARAKVVVSRLIGWFSSPRAWKGRSRAD